MTTQLRLSGQSVDPVVAVYGEWLDLLNEFRELVKIHGEIETPEMDELMERHIGAGRVLTRLIPTTNAGIAALAHVLWEDHVRTWRRIESPEYAAEFWRPDSLLIYAIWQGATGLPLESGPFPMPQLNADGVAE